VSSLVDILIFLYGKYLPNCFVLSLWGSLKNGLDVKLVFKQIRLSFEFSATSLHDLIALHLEKNLLQKYSCLGDATIPTPAKKNPLLAHLSAIIQTN